jgi:hypothetical protein
MYSGFENGNALCWVKQSNPILDTNVAWKGLKNENF